VFKKYNNKWFDEGETNWKEDKKKEKKYAGNLI